jgi:hypothetical protein
MAALLGRHAGGQRQVRAALRGRAGRGVARLGVRTVIPHDVADSATHRSRTLRDLSQMDRALATNQPSSMRSSDPVSGGRARSAAFLSIEAHRDEMVAIGVVPDPALRKVDAAGGR